MMKPARKLIRVRCPECDGSGKVWHSVRDDNAPHGITNTTTRCEHCIDGVQTRPMPRTSKLRGITRARIVLHPTGRDSGEYQHPAIDLFGADEERQRPELSITFQRHRLDFGDHLNAGTPMPDERCDVGLPWSCGYAPAVEHRFSRGFPLEEIALMKHACATVERIRDTWQKVPRNECDIARTIDALECLGVPVVILYAVPRADAVDLLTVSELRERGNVTFGPGRKLVLAHRDGTTARDLVTGRAVA